MDPISFRSRFTHDDQSLSVRIDGKMVAARLPSGHWYVFTYIPGLEAHEAEAVIAGFRAAVWACPNGADASEIRLMGVQQVWQRLT